MDHAKLRELLQLLTEFKVETFKNADLEINFSGINFLKTDFKEEKPEELDADELILKQIEEMKVRALANITQG